MNHDTRLLRDIVDNTPLPIAVYTGEELTIAMVNAAMITTWGKGDQIVGKKYLDVLPEIKDEDFFQQALTVLKTGKPFHGKDKKVDLVIHGTVKIHYFNYSFIPLVAEDGSVYGVMNTGADVTEIHMAKLQVQSAEERLRMAIDAAEMGTYEIDLASKKVKTSGNFNSIVGIEGEISNDELLAKLHPEDLDVSKKARDEALITGKVCYESRIINKDRNARWTKINGKVINDESGKPTAIIGIIQDIHEQREFEQELQRQVIQNTDELRRSNDDLLHFANVVSHDLREPVRKIKIFNSLLGSEKGTVFNESGKKYLTKIDQSADRMDSIIEGILSYSTLDKTRQPIELIDLGAVIESIKSDLELIIKEKGAILNVAVLPKIEGAPILITQLFYNLIQNALKFSKADEPPRVIISSVPILLKGENAIEISIKDNGIGLDAKFAEKIFTAFERLNSKDQYQGNGLGLSLCRKIAKRHNGTITAGGESNNGAEFVVTLPLKQTAANI